MISQQFCKMGSFTQKIFDCWRMSRLDIVSSCMTLLPFLFVETLFCAGSTSANAAEGLGLRRVFYTDSPGLDGFVEAIENALDACQTASR